MIGNFSVLMPIYFKEKPDSLQLSLNSIWHDQTLKPSEIIIVKDGPLTPELDQVIDDFSNNAPLKIIALKKNQGTGTALNIGLSHCSNEIVARMDSDDISKPERFIKQINYFKLHPNIDVISSWIDEFYETPENIISIKKIPEHHNKIYNYAQKRCPVNHPTTVFKKTAVIAAGSYKPFPLFEDYYLWVRMLMCGAKFYNFQESLLLFRSNRDTYKRRGGLKHSIDELKLQLLFKKIGFISLSRMSTNIIIRTSIRLMPNNLRFHFYRLFLRK